MPPTRAAFYLQRHREAGGKWRAKDVPWKQDA